MDAERRIVGRGNGSGARRRVAAAVLGSLALAFGLTAATPRDGHAQSDGVATMRAADYRGWDYLVEKLVADGVDRRRVHRAFTDSRVEPFTGLEFGLWPREPSAMYRGFTRAGSIALARRCKAAHEDTLLAAERAHGVPASVVAAIIHVESGCGKNTGSEIVLWRLARLAMANEPSNLRANIERHTEGLDDPAIERRTRERGQYLEDTFYPEVLATFQMSDRLDIDPLALRGSGSGAFGMPQFLPRSYLSYGSDGNGDGRVSLYDPEDAIFSCANYLAAHGWKPGLSRAEQRRIIWHYNRSDAYIDAVLGLADELDSPGRTMVATRASSDVVKKARSTAKASKVATSSKKAKAGKTKSSAKKSSAKTVSAKAKKPAKSTN